MHKVDYEMHEVERMYFGIAMERWKAYGTRKPERLQWNAVEIAWSWKPCSGTHTFERSQWNHIEAEALPMIIVHSNVRLRNSGCRWATPILAGT